MGLIRTLLAISVVLSHCNLNIFLTGTIPVQLFYMISGFLISYVIVEKKTYSTIKNFYLNRYLKLYPIYLFVAILQLIIFLKDAFLSNKNIEFFNTYYNAPFTADLMLILANFSLFFQDWIMFSGVENNLLVFTTNFSRSDVLLWNGLLVPQAWSIGVELGFYLIAPFILPQQKLLFTLLFLSLGIRIYLTYIGLGSSDPWTYRFFPAELALFLIGSISHQFILPFYRNILSKENIGKYSTIATYFLILIFLIFDLIPIHGLVKHFLIFGIFFVFMPFTFLFQCKRDWDKWIGDLSYPIYIFHMLIIYQMSSVDIDSHVSKSLLVVTHAIVISIVWIILIQKPVEVLRSKLKYKN
jgi:peptidoglycan/LPS O-acetylase OafA/YrhL